MILIFGANGFLGQHLVELLRKTESNIIATYRKSPPVNSNFSGVQWEQCDILDIDRVYELCSQVSYVYHCANTISFDTNDADNMFHNNVEGTANIVNACIEHNITKLVHVSSVAAIARDATGVQINEETPWVLDEHISQYGISKYKAEMEVWRGSAEGLSVAIVNPSVILGEGNWNEGSSQLFKNVYHEFPFYTAGGNGFVDVLDVCKAMVLLMQSSIKNERFIINAENVPYKDLFTKIAISFNKKPPKYFATPWMSAIVWRAFAFLKIFTGKTPLITKETAQTANAVFDYNNQKLKTTFPEFNYLPIDETIKRVVTYYKNQHS